MVRTRILLIILLAGFSTHAQTFTEKLSRELTFEKPSRDNALVIANMFGNVQVQAYEGAAILLEATKTIDAKTDDRLEKGKTEVQLGVIDRADTIIIYVKDGCHEFGRNRLHQSNRAQAGWNYQSDGRGDCRMTYDYKMDFVLKVPAHLNLLVSTVNDGNVVVENVTGVVKAVNVNGSIRLSKLVSYAEANTINGDVDIEYASNPDRECRFYSLNGDINALFQPGLSANLSFESFNGNIYTNLTRIENLPARINKTNRGDGLQYKINGNEFKIGNGGPLLDFETFNGNVYLKEIR